MEDYRVKVDFFNINTGETIYVDRPAQIKAAIESSDLGVNRQSDRGWRIGKEWKAKLRQARDDRHLMGELAKMYGGDVSESQLLVAVFRREAIAARQKKSYQDTAPFEDEYHRSIAPKQPETKVEEVVSGGETYTPDPAIVAKVKSKK